MPVSLVSNKRYSYYNINSETRKRSPKIAFSLMKCVVSGRVGVCADSGFGQGGSSKFFRELPMARSAIVRAK